MAKSSKGMESLISDILERVTIAYSVAGVISRSASSRIADIDEVSCCCDVLKDYMLSTADIIETNSMELARGKGCACV